MGGEGEGVALSRQLWSGVCVEVPGGRAMDTTADHTCCGGKYLGVLPEFEGRGGSR